MSDIEISIQTWRRDLLEREGIRAEHADELEDHLREEIGRLETATLSEKEMFLVATHRLGRSDRIAAEMEKVDARAVWRRRWIWMLVGYVILNAANRLSSWVNFLGQWMSHGLSQAGVRTSIVATYLLCTLIVILIARRATFMNRGSDVPSLFDRLKRPRGILALALAGLALELVTMVVFPLTSMFLEWKEGYTRVDWSGSFGWILGLVLGFIPVAALCVLLWQETRQRQDSARPEVEA